MELTFTQYSILYNMLSLTAATMAASGIFFIAARGQVAKEFRPSLIMSAVVVFVASYHYFRIFGSLDGAFELVGGEGGTSRAGTYVPSAEGEPFNEAYRYADWIITVPLLLAELISVMQLKKSGGLLFRLILATVAMLVTGYIGEVGYEAGSGGYALWGTISSIPFAYIVYVLFAEMSDAIQDQPGHAKVLLRNMRYLLLFAWGFYPIVYCFPFLGISGPSAFVGINVGYAIADLTAKAGWGIMIYGVARAKTEAKEAAGATAAA